MSAIFGIFDPDSTLPGSDLELLANALESYGRDGGRSWLDGAVGLGHQMSRVTQEDAWERMPYRDERSGVVITADTRLDNREELCRTLSISSPGEEAPVADSRLVLAAYLRWGAECPAHLLGDFAFALWDPHKRELFCARDHVGVKPLFYSHRGSRFVFASDLHGLHATPGVPRELDEAALRELLVYGDVPGTTHTLWRHVRRLPPAHALTVSAGGLIVRSFWSFEGLDEILFSSDEQYREQLRELLDQAIGSRLRCAFPVGAHLTGGLDSSSIAILSARRLRDSGKELETFSWAPPPEREEDGSDDERRHVIEVCNAESLRCHYTTVSVEDALAFQRRDISIEPVETLQREHVVERKAAAMGIRVMVSGWGGDELVSFNGRGYFAELAMSLRWWTLARELYAKARLDRDGWRRGPEFLALVASRVIEPFLPDRLLAILRPEALVTPLPDFVSDELAARTRHTPWLPRQPSRELRSVRANQHALLRDGHLQKRMEDWAQSGGRQGLVYVYPLLDKRLVEFALRLPARLFFREGWKRYLYRWAMEGIVPEAVRWNPSKREPSLARQAALLRESIRRELGRSESVSLPKSHPYVSMDRVRNARRLGTGLRQATTLRRLDGLAMAAKVLRIGPLEST